MDKQGATFWIISFATLLLVARTPVDFLAWQAVREGEARLRQVEIKIAAMGLASNQCREPVALDKARP